ncbi:class I SAM-dependent methyltransferase [Candidatus Magnetobacterium casense]|uniref:Methyltransferase domain-containing protein n=1 Tax=Candidatus Magnetobacterium casense TaxID=1455061 RepID=A0ABS6RUM0_9BACT|nr:methyltransferase domain-containing protein [Candidatus Magnetobacterium casensis]MBV6340320.1 methyltransferase domain-containing protein [Candidatus Magnetobacterium casensis]
MDTERLRIERELVQGAKIKGMAEDIWGWSSPAGRVRAERRADYFIRLGEILPAKDVLEIGCGTGVFTEKIARTGANITAVDISDDLLEVAERKCVKNCCFQKANVHDLPYGGLSFDTVIGSSVLHHLDVEVALRELFRVLRHNGKIVFAEPNMLNPQIFLERKIAFLHTLRHVVPHETAFLRKPIKRLLEDHGFIDVKVFPYDFLHPVVPQIAVNVVSKVGFFLEKISLIREIAGSLIIYAVKPKP